MKKSKNLGGRPTVMTPEVLGKLEQAFAIDATVKEALSYADIGQDAFYDYLKKNPSFSERIEKLRDRPVLAARQRTVTGIKESYANAMDYLKRKRKLEFSERTEVTGAEGEAITVQISETIAKKNNLQANQTQNMKGGSNS